MRIPQRKIISAAITLALAAGWAHAELERMGPISRAPTIGGYPTWFQDKTGVTVEFCDMKSPAELDGGWCVLAPPGLSYPENFFTAGSFFDEHFYYRAVNLLKDLAPPGGFTARLVIAVEAAFANAAVIDGDQMTFGRHRVFIPNLPWDGDYRVITPFSDITYFDQKAGDRIFDTNDVGAACINTFECTLGTGIGPYLLPSKTAGGPEVPPMPDLKTALAGTDPFYEFLVTNGAPTPDPGTGKKYIADPSRVGPVTGSPQPDFKAFNQDQTTTLRNHNTFRIEVRAPSPTHNGAVIYTIDGENNFSTYGRLMTGAIPGQVSIDRASYTADASGTVQHVDVFAKASETLQARLPAGTIPPKSIPILAFFDVPCAGAIGTDPKTLLPIINPPPYLSPVTAEIPMAGNGSDFWAQSQLPASRPSHVCVKDATARNALGQIIPAYFLKQVSDDVTIKSATFDRLGTLSITAESSDMSAKLTAAAIGTGGQGLLLSAAGSASVPNLLAPPSKVQVVSTGGGAAVVPVLTSATAGGVSNTGPVAVADSKTILEDSGVVVLDPLANDQNAAGGTVTITQNPTLGTAFTDGKTIAYTPGLNLNGLDAIGYKVTVGTAISNQAAITITITPVNDAPTAVNDSVNAIANLPLAINVLANDTDPDGAADIVAAVNITQPVGPAGATTAVAGGVVTFKAVAAGSYTFTYQARDSKDATSANTATVTVQVAAAENMIISRVEYVSKKTRLRVQGNIAPAANQTITLEFVNAAGTVLRLAGTASADAVGSWALDTTVALPAGATQIKATSSNGTAQFLALAIKN
jgi:hypothetical protein